MLKLLERAIVEGERTAGKRKRSEEETGKTGGHGNLIHRPGESLWYNPKSNGDGNTEVDGGPRGRGQNGGGDV